MIRVVNLRNYKENDNEVLIRVDRSSILGNPYRMFNESQRDKVCDLYEKRFLRIVNGEENNPHFRKELKRIYEIAKKHDVALGCWCSPKRCHAETIKEYLDYVLSMTTPLTKHRKEK